MSKFQKQLEGVTISEEQMKIKEDFVEKSNGLNSPNKTNELSSKNEEDKDINKTKEKEKEYLENTCLNLRKILHILEL